MHNLLNDTHFQRWLGLTSADTYTHLGMNPVRGDSVGVPPIPSAPVFHSQLTISINVGLRRATIRRGSTLVFLWLLQWLKELCTSPKTGLLKKQSSLTRSITPEL